MIVTFLFPMKVILYKFTKMESYHIVFHKVLSIRYPIDSYDRLWYPLNFNDWKVTSTESTVYTQSIDEGYKLPAEVLQTAVVAENASIPLSLYFTPPRILLLNVMFTFTLQRLRSL